MTHEPPRPAAPSIALNNGTEIPQLGLGVFQIPPDQVVRTVLTAIAAGYRLVDTAAAYGNEEGVGRAITSSGVPRHELYVTTKLWNSDHGYDRALRAFDRSLARLGLDHVDLYLIHWPLPGRDDYLETWKALERIASEGRARAIGVSNFSQAHLDRLRAETEVVPVLNQIELHPRLSQASLRRYHDDHGIRTQAWSPLGQGKGLLGDPVLGGLAVARRRSAAQVVLRWHVQLGNLAIPKSVTPERIRSNLDVFDFALTDADMATLATLDRGQRVGPDPEAFDAQ
ncbi:MAG: aldo/keto reductase [Acidimicrobiales bacterium]